MKTWAFLAGIAVGVFLAVVLSHLCCRPQTKPPEIKDWGPPKEKS